MTALVPLLILAARILIPAGYVAPRLEGVTFDGTRYSEQIAGQVTIVDFFATWCPHCRESLEGYRRLKEVRDVRVIIVDTEEEPALVAAFFNAHPPAGGVGVLLDPTGEARRAWRVTGFPTAYLIDQNGVIRDSFSGWGPGSARELAEEIDALQRPARRAAPPPPPAANPGRTAVRATRRGKKQPPQTLDDRARQMGIEVIR